MAYFFFTQLGLPSANQPLGEPQHEANAATVYPRCVMTPVLTFVCSSGYYAPPLIGRGIKLCFCLTNDVCLSVAYIGRNSRTERPRKTIISTEVTHVTRDSDTIFKVKRSKVKVARPIWFVVLAGQHGHTVMVTKMRTLCHHLQAWAGHIVAAARLQPVK